MKQENLTTSSIDGQARFQAWFDKFQREFFGAQERNRLRAMDIAIPGSEKEKIQSKDPAYFENIMSSYKRR